jgi:hypothetical protein
MKTIEVAQKEAYFLDRLMSDMRLQSIENAHGAGFLKGIEFSQRWIPIEVEMPKSMDIILLKYNMNNSEFSDYVSTGHLRDTEFIIDIHCENENMKVTHWRPISF